MIVFISNFFNHHQAPVGEAIARLNPGGYRFVELVEMPDSFRKSGYPDYSASPLCIHSWRSEKEMTEARRLIDEARAVVVGELHDFGWIRRRLESGKLTFIMSERWLKRGLINILSPSFLKFARAYRGWMRRYPLYQLCASAYAASDLSRLGMMRGRCFKWGYFTPSEELDTESILEARQSRPYARFIWIGRLIGWKRPELAIEASKILSDKGIKFKTDIYGAGPLEGKLWSLTARHGLESCVALKGNLPNTEILKELEESDALLMTSTRREGWGAVVGEAMGRACYVIGSRESGAVPYLLNGWGDDLIFSHGKADHLAAIMEHIALDPHYRRQKACEAYETIHTGWSACHAAERLLRLVDALQKGNASPFASGVCSTA